MAPKVFKWGKQAIKKDLANRYDLLDDWVLPKITDPKHLLHNFLIEGHLGLFNGQFTVYKYHNTPEKVECNGCTLSPDKCIIPTVVGAIFHDKAYDFIEVVAKLTGRSEAEVREVFDAVFGNILMSLAYQIKNKVRRVLAIGVAGTYFSSVHVFGGIAHQVFKIVSLFMVFFMLSGCAVPKLWDWNEPLNQPNYENVTK